jgi:hypothetical protein
MIHKCEQKRIDRLVIEQFGIELSWNAAGFARRCDEAAEGGDVAVERGAAKDARGVVSGALMPQFA